MLVPKSSVFSLLYVRLNLKKYIQGQLSAKPSVPPFPPSATVCLSPPSPTEGGLSVHPHSPQPAFPTTTALRPSVCLLCDHCPEGVLCLSLLLSPSQHPSLSCTVIDMDAEGEGGPVCQSRRWKMKAQMKEACSVY